MYINYSSITTQSKKHKLKKKLQIFNFNKIYDKILA